MLLGSACSDSTTTPATDSGGMGYEILHTPQLSHFMQATGCRRLDSSTVVQRGDIYLGIPTNPGEPWLFACNQNQVDSVWGALAAYRDAGGASQRWASAQADPGEGNWEDWGEWESQLFTPPYGFMWNVSGPLKICTKNADIWYSEVLVGAGRIPLVFPYYDESSSEMPYCLDVYEWTWEVDWSSTRWAWEPPPVECIICGDHRAFENDEPEWWGGSSSSNPYTPVSITITGPDTVYVGKEATFTATVTYQSGSSASGGSWSSSNPEVLRSDWGGVFTPLAEGGATVTAAIPGLNISDSKGVTVVLAACGGDNDPNVALLQTGDYDDLPCAIPEDYDTLCPNCSHAGWAVAGWTISVAGCGVAGQGPECLGWFKRLMGGDTTTLTLTATQFDQITKALTADTVWLPVGIEGSPPVMFIGKADTLPEPRLTNVTYNGVTYPWAQKYDFANTSWELSIGKATVYFDSLANPVAFKDDYDFNKDERGWFTELMVTALRKAVQNRKFTIRYP